MKELEAAWCAWVLSCPTHSVYLVSRKCDSLCEGPEEGGSAQGLREVKVQGLTGAEGFSVYYKIHYTNTADQKV